MSDLDLSIPASDSNKCRYGKSLLSGTRPNRITEAHTSSSWNYSCSLLRPAPLPDLASATLIRNLRIRFVGFLLRSGLIQLPLDAAAQLLIERHSVLALQIANQPLDLLPKLL